MAGEDGFPDDPDAAVIAGEFYAWAGGVSWYIIWNVQLSGQIGENGKQAGAELGQAQLQLELSFTLIKVCCIILMITNYHYISLSTISL